jgi:hypothetical protein
MADKIGGVAYLKVDGNQYALRGNLVVSPDPFEREGKAGQDGVHGFTETPRVPYIEGDITDMGGLSLEKLRAIIDNTVTAELANGKVYVARNAWTAGARELNTSEGTTKVKFEAKKIDEVMK